MRVLLGYAATFALASAASGSACAWYETFVLENYDPKFARAPIAAFEIGRDLSMVAGLAGGVAFVLGWWIVTKSRRQQLMHSGRRLAVTTVLGVAHLLVSTLPFLLGRDRSDPLGSWILSYLLLMPLVSGGLLAILPFGNGEDSRAHS
jgi:hypothetical protein